MARTAASSATAAAPAKGRFPPQRHPASRLRHHAKWLDYLDKMLETRSVPASADAVGVHRNTTFDGAIGFEPTNTTGPSAWPALPRPTRCSCWSRKKDRASGAAGAQRGGVAWPTRGITHEHVYILVARDRTADAGFRHRGVPR